MIMTGLIDVKRVGPEEFGRTIGVYANDMRARFVCHLRNSFTNLKHAFAGIASDRRDALVEFTAYDSAVGVTLCSRVYVDNKDQRPSRLQFDQEPKHRLQFGVVVHHVADVW